VESRAAVKTNAKDAMDERKGRDGRTMRVARTAGRSFFAPLASFSRTLWLEVTGTFFAMIALAMGSAAWRLRAAVHLPSSAHEAQRLYLCAGIFLAFAYFAVSSFVRARRT
jgi:protein-S-isoprenylcysteine O-methyltransferase Ste14